ncbi:DUF6514 family protein [Oscillibacter sp.]|uniref:DUF6514 family protein n=1 Tax=Oscillibacter sp. TaxID=1945593 RepID=UPI00289A0B71|nr:DUF6514 family protein [Oscillibacter sp.]
MMNFYRILEEVSAMKEFLITTRQTHTEDGQPLTLHYFILVEKRSENISNYGLRISEMGRNTYSMSPGLTKDPQRILDLIDMLANGTVTPTGLADVIADWP